MCVFDININVCVFLSSAACYRSCLLLHRWSPIIKKTRSYWKEESVRVYPGLETKGGNLLSFSFLWMTAGESGWIRFVPYWRVTCFYIYIFDHMEYVHLIEHTNMLKKNLWGWINLGIMRELDSPVLILKTVSSGMTVNLEERLRTMSFCG